ncbi:hypothetical protein GCM10023318_50890 [Nocardia callitridis]|uniref:SGNH hydrolase-type esterase domain-containing protein n=1 Tax=Nocardia callitridis TaxID=648753 RepID=A0ABP9KUC3_9NOCA
MTADTQLVTLTIGGNDLGLIGTMIARSCGPAVAPYSAAAEAICPAVVGASTAPGPADFDALEQKITDVVRAVQNRAPGAEILLVEYLPAVDPQATTCASLPLSPDDARTTRRTYDGLVTATRAAALATGTTSVGHPEADQHKTCSAAPWINGFENPLTTGNITSIASSYHPNLEGMTATADHLAQTLDT